MDENDTKDNEGDTRESRAVKHPLLSWHYSTIGIGDVFLEAPPSLSLPSCYLPAPDEGDGTGENEEFLSREIVGRIKSKPEDFIVREIALPNRSIPEWSDIEIEARRLASLDETHHDQTDTSTKNMLTTSVLDERIPLAKRRRTDRTFSQPQQSNPLKDSTTKMDNSYKRTKQDTDVSQSTLALANLDPKKLMSSMIQTALEQDKNDHRTAESVLKSIEELQSKLLSLLKNCKPNNGEERFNSDQLVLSVGQVWIPPLSTMAREERGQFHRSLRRLFPVLQSESVSQDSGGKGSSAKEGEDPKAKFQSHQIRVSVDPLFLCLAPYLIEPHVDLPVLYEYFKCKFGCEDGSNETPGEGQTLASSPSLRVRPDLERKERGAVHHIIKEKTRSSLVTKTFSSKSETAVISVRWSRNSKKISARKRKKIDGSARLDRCLNTLVVVRKYQKDHGKLHETIYRTLGCPRSDVSFAGKKDLVAETFQFCTIRAVTPQQLEEAKPRMASLQFGKAATVDWILQKGDLAGNRFEIVVRDVSRISVVDVDDKLVERSAACHEEHVQQNVKRLERHGFINFFGEQRVGRAGEKRLVGVRSFDIGRALLREEYLEAIDLIMACGDNNSERDDIRGFRKSWIEQERNANATLKLLPKHAALSKERTLLNGWKRYNGDAKTALGCIPEEERQFWISAYQSYIWNHAATKRIEVYGSKSAVAGDLVLTDSSTCDEPRVHDGKSTIDIRHVVLPLPGTKMLYPSNRIGQYYEKLLSDDGIDIRQQSDTSRKGSYRFLLAPVGNLEHKIFEESNKTHLHLQFDLPSGSFATMMMRELMTTTISRQEELPTGSP